MTSPRRLTEQQQTTIRGKILAGEASPEEVLSVFRHIDLLEDTLALYAETLSVGAGRD